MKCFGINGIKLLIPFSTNDQSNKKFFCEIENNKSFLYIPSINSYKLFTY